MMNPRPRLLIWLAASAVIALGLYGSQVLSLVMKGGQMLSGTFRNTYPLAGLFLVVVFLLLRWGEIEDALSRERGFTSSPLIRLVGVVLTLIPLVFPNDTWNPMVLAGMTVMLVSYGTSLAINPLVSRAFLPYPVMYLLAIWSPLWIQTAFGEPLADVASFLTGVFLNLMSVPASWEGRQIELHSRPGGLIQLNIDPSCSSMQSITIFLLLCGLMHLDLKKNLSSTIRFASLGVIVLTLLNAMRIAVLAWVGYIYGGEALWSAHNWLGYAMFTGFYVVALIAYTGMSRQKPAGSG